MSRKKTGTKTRSALRILDNVTGHDAALRQEIAVARVQARVAQLIYDARTQAGLTQRELAELIGTRQPVIARLEDADYEGHSLSMLQKIAQALHRRVEIRLPAEHSLQPA
jgi:ribosome-binding protein aMBF1 (putative translation factor)